ncbi:MAG TPA: 2-C-methyl-D-erythritol 4-phosphate cytidylyltransferase [Solirubrobacteraceae bacterium]|jgi:2-C-methyl-D-erythritol 4-phosphate cytidylyltransferase|nr:2-C-methyl-D-erythritol 4-phosphate cytidylyltransferase [Solirubrobacteraceae bacterium]
MAVALIVAAGSGERLGAGRPKALVELGGRPMLAWSLFALRDVPRIQRIVVAVPPGMMHVSTPGVDDAFRLFVEGGSSRSESVRRALAAAGPGDPVLVHDAARPLLTAALAEQVLAALAADPDADAAIAAVPVTDTIKRAGRAGGAVRETLDRGELWAVQTPQVFRRAALEHALAASTQELARATDDAWLIEREGGKVIVVPASDENLKVTTPLDLEVAELLLARRSAADGS